jgi:alpha-beta hydrolase superfamily lysophospholipase
MKYKWALMIAIALFLLVFGGAWMGATLLIAPHQRSVGHLPTGMHGQSVEFPSASGATLHGWFLPGKRNAGAVLLMHGIRASRLSMLERARMLNQEGYSVLLFDFQAHGESLGEHITFGHLESMDAQAALALMRKLAPGEQTGLIGVSMGAAAALLADPMLDVQAWVLEEVYSSIEQAITNRLSMRLGGWAKILTPLLSWQLGPRLGIAAEDLCPLQVIGRVSAPKLLIAAAEDRHVRLEESMRIFDAAKTPKELWVVDDVAHVDLHAFDNKEYRRRILQFFQKHLRDIPQEP